MSKEHSSSSTSDQCHLLSLPSADRIHENYVPSVKFMKGLTHVEQMMYLCFSKEPKVRKTTGS